MSAATATGVARPGPSQSGPTIVSTMRSEWTKFRTLRSSLITLGVAGLLVIGLSALISFAVAANGNRPEADAKAHPLRIMQGGWELGLLAFMVLGVLVVTNEYSSGLIGATFMSTPRRARVLLAKVTVFTLTAFVAGEVMSFVNFFLSHARDLGLQRLPQPLDQRPQRAPLRDRDGDHGDARRVDRARRGHALAPYGRFDSSLRRGHLHPPGSAVRAPQLLEQPHRGVLAYTGRHQGHRDRRRAPTRSPRGGGRATWRCSSWSCWPVPATCSSNGMPERRSRACTPRGAPRCGWR